MENDNRIFIEAAVSFGVVVSGKSVSEIEKELKAELWPESTPLHATHNLYCLKKGYTRNLDTRKVHIICGVCQCDPKILFGIN